MALISLDEAREYLRVDSADEDAVTTALLSAAARLCADVARLTDEQWADIDSDKCRSDRYTSAELAAVRETMRVAILYALGYLFEHREEADHHALTLTLRSLLFGIREGVV
ncbi:MAG: phage gp6-like head-tail connector protein [Clostridia bacterium]|nr:phage gp6-like head-tail connector protein [Clostridia bacterium]